MSSASARSRSPATIRSDRRLGAGIAVSVLLHALLLSLQFGMPGLDLGSGGPIAVTLAPDAPPNDAPPVSAPVPLAAEPVPAAAPPVPVAVPTPAPVPVPAPQPARVHGLRLVDLPPPPPAVKIAQPASAQARPKRGKPSIKRRVRELPAPVIVAAPNPDSEFSVPLPEVVPQSTPEPAPLLAQETEDQATTPPSAQSAFEETATGMDDEAEQLARLVVEEQRQRAQDEAQERERIARQAADEARAAQLEAQELLARQQLEQQQRQEQEQALLAHQEQERVAREAAAAARANDELMRRREAQELASRQLADQRAAEQAALQAQAAAQERARADALRLAREQAERQYLDAQRLAREQAERERIEAQNRLAQERARQQADERARADAERLARQQAQAARRSAAERLQAQGPGAAPGSGQPDSSGLGAGGPGVGDGADNVAGNGAGDRSQPGALAGMPGSRARELLRGLTIPGAGVALPAARRDDPRRALADGGERDAPLRLYVDSVRQKLERNALLGGARLALRDVRIDPLVSLALRSDGSIDEVTIVRSSGRADIDEAVRRFVRLNARYSAFPPNVAARFDVIEIRRIWRFTDGLKLLEEMR